MNTYEVTSPTKSDFYALIEFQHDKGYGYQFILSITAEPTFHSLYYETLSEATTEAFEAVGELANQS